VNGGVGGVGVEDVDLAGWGGEVVCFYGWGWWE
jgi:hypothetical protein